MEAIERDAAWALRDELEIERERRMRVEAELERVKLHAMASERDLYLRGLAGRPQAGGSGNAGRRVAAGGHPRSLKELKDARKVTLVRERRHREADATATRREEMQRVEDGAAAAAAGARRLLPPAAPATAAAAGSHHYPHPHPHHRQASPTRRSVSRTETPLDPPDVLLTAWRSSPQRRRSVGGADHHHHPHHHQHHHHHRSQHSEFVSRGVSPSRPPPAALRRPSPGAAGGGGGRRRSPPPPGHYADYHGTEPYFDADAFDFSRPVEQGFLKQRRRTEASEAEHHRGTRARAAAAAAVVAAGKDDSVPRGGDVGRATSPARAGAAAGVHLSAFARAEAAAAARAADDEAVEEALRTKHIYVSHKEDVERDTSPCRTGRRADVQRASMHVADEALSLELPTTLPDHDPADDWKRRHMPRQHHGRARGFQSVSDAFELGGHQGSFFA
eukprot:Rhum_TRINITY_DN14257_c7_g1::Rhum_TRINITY_DN14257_c7_g1_i1::g.76056::m.76056